jgi:hypothetical protein
MVCGHQSGKCVLSIPTREGQKVHIHFGHNSILYTFSHLPLVMIQSEKTWAVWIWYHIGPCINDIVLFGLMNKKLKVYGRS